MNDNNAPGGTAPAIPSAFGVAGWALVERKPRLASNPGQPPATEWVVEDVLIGLRVASLRPTAVPKWLCARSSIPRSGKPCVPNLSN